MTWLDHQKPLRLVSCAAAVLVIVLVGRRDVGPDHSGHGHGSGVRTGGGRDSSSSRRCRTLLVLSPSEISELETLSLKSCNLTSLHPSIEHATKLRLLDVSDNPFMTTLPEELIQCSNLSVLFSSSNPGIRTLPSVLGRMTSLTRLGWRSGSLTSLEAGESVPPNLVHLILTDNRISELDDEGPFRRMGKVKKLMLSHNRIRSMSGPGVAHLRDLELVRLAGNDLGEVSEELWSLPKLAWVTLSGNPRLGLEFKPRKKGGGTGDDAVGRASSSSVPRISPSNLGPAEEGAPGDGYLGQGASGTVTARTWDGRGVAVKIIHGVTSDGRAEDELKAYEALGRGGMEHRVVGCLALLDGSGAGGSENSQWDGRRGVVMDRLPPGMVDLALPPTIEEVTADRWWNSTDINNGDNARKADNAWTGIARPPFSPSFVSSALSDLADALLYLHGSIGLAHGDVYGHNVKVDPEKGRLYLLDLGASWGTGGSGKYARQAERVEVRAFGVLVGELAERILKREVGTEDGKKAKLVLAALEHLRDECMDENVQRRPTLQVVSERLRELS